MYMHQENEKKGHLKILLNEQNLSVFYESLMKKEIKYLTKVFHEVNNYPMSIINTIAQQELNDSQSKNRRAEAN